MAKLAVLSGYDVRRIGRFMTVGVSNAVLHFGILNFVFFILSQSKIMSSIIATVFAMSYSFILNRNYVFNAKTKKMSSYAIRFIIVTVTGMFLVHNLIYIFSLWLLTGEFSGLVSFVQMLSNGILSKEFIEINASTIAGALFAMIWNYNGYRLLVFKSRDSRETDNE